MVVRSLQDLHSDDVSSLPRGRLPPSLLQAQGGFVSLPLPRVKTTLGSIAEMEPLGVGRGAPASEAEMDSRANVRERIRLILYGQKMAISFRNALRGRVRRRQQQRDEESTCLLENLDRDQPDEATPPQSTHTVPATQDEATMTRHSIQPSSVSIDHLKQHQKRYSSYSLMTLLFMVTMFAEYLLSASTSISVTKMLFTIALGALFIIDAILFKIKSKNCGTALVCLSWFLLVLLLYILLLSFNKDYAYAILPVPLPMVAACLQHKLKPGRGQSSTPTVQSGEVHIMEARLQAGTDSASEADEHARDEDKLLNHIFKLSSGIVNCGGLINMVLGCYMVGQVHIARLFFFFTIVLGLYLMMVTTIRITILTRHATYLSMLLKGLLMITVITVVIHGVIKWGKKLSL